MARHSCAIRAFFGAGVAKTLFAILLSGLAFASLGETVRADEDASGLRLIVNRSEDAVTIYTALPGSLLPDRFGAVPPPLQAGPEGLDLDELSRGTGDTAGWLTARAEARLGDRAVVLEPLSVMVHPIELDMPFQTPHDGAIATAVCVAPPMGPQQLDALTVFAGFHLDGADGSAPLMLRLGTQGAGGHGTVRTFWNWLPLSDSKTELRRDGWIDLGTGPRFPGLAGSGGALAVAGIASMAILGVIAALAAMRRRDNQRTPRPGSVAADS